MQAVSHISLKCHPLLNVSFGALYICFEVAEVTFCSGEIVRQFSIITFFFKKLLSLAQTFLVWADKFLFCLSAHLHDDTRRPRCSVRPSVGEHHMCVMIWGGGGSPPAPQLNPRRSPLHLSSKIKIPLLLLHPLLRWPL